jgi:glycosyltransferase involved in cell wall biosynthesis
MIPRILLLTPQYPRRTSDSVGGLFTHAAELHAGLARLGCPVAVLTPRIDGGPTEVHDRVHWLRPSDQVLALPLAPDGEPTERHLALYSQELVQYVIESMIERLQPEERPQLIHVHDYYLVPAALELRRRLGIPVVLSVHILHAPLRTWWGSPLVPAVVGLERMACQSADAIITVSRAMKDVLASELGVAEDKIAVVHNGFDPGPFRQPPSDEQARRARTRLGINGAEPVVVYAGRLTRQKGVVPLLRSAVQVIERVPDVVYALAGTPTTRQGQTDERLELLDQIDAIFARHPALARQVRLLGNLSRPELAHVYHQAAIAAIPSVYEPFGYAAVEAMAAGVPVVATDVGGLPEIIEHETTGLLVPVHKPAHGEYRIDEDALAAAQLRVLGDRALADRLTRRGREHAIAGFSHEGMAGETLEVYRRIAQVGA